MTFDEALQATGAAVVVANQRGLITYVNPTFETLFGWRSGEIVGQPIAVLMPARYRDAHHLGFSRYLSTGVPTLLDRPLRLMAVSREGREFDTEHRILAERRDDEWVFLALIRPIDGNGR